MKSVYLGIVLLTLTSGCSSEVSSAYSSTQEMQTATKAASPNTSADSFTVTVHIEDAYGRLLTQPFTYDHSKQVLIDLTRTASYPAEECNSPSRVVYGLVDGFKIGLDIELGSDAAIFVQEHKVKNFSNIISGKVPCGEQNNKPETEMTQYGEYFYPTNTSANYSVSLSGNRIAKLSITP
ncbi:hypothetical protein [Vibrio brasiliensis]|uniref:hypothetical protein n=1 Tax=Vibrio brasiliensis TaxID=170652 RepID=UPI001EFD6BF6|nr:hypothetical protein [Vibrio brasiliensis]MCG9724499.1 hypothetical protein [Vibrio brasiliensis]